MNITKSAFSALTLPLFLVGNWVASAADTVQAPSALPPAAIVSRFAHERLWQRTIETILPNGRTWREVREYSELATGICRRDDASGSWIDASPEIEIVNGVPVARNTQ